MAQEKLRVLIQEIAKEQKYENCSISIKPISSGGANYSSHLFLATVWSPGKKVLHLFAKCAAIGEELRASIPTAAFTTEHDFYTDLVKAYRKIENKYNVKDEDKLVLATYYGASAEYLHETLVLENLTKRGYESFDRFQSVDWPYARYSIKQLAIFHALSVAYKREDPAGYKSFLNKLMPISPEAMGNILDIDVDKTVSSVKAENKERVAKFLQRPNMTKPMLHLLNVEGPMIIHADYRPNNMMHKKLCNGTTEVMVLDYQTLRVGNPVVDLLYFLFASTDKKFRDQYLQQSFALYYHELSSALRRFNLDPNVIYSKATYEKDLKENMPYMLSTSFYLLLIITIDEASGHVSADLSGLRSFLDPNSLYVERLNDWIDDCVAMGVL